MTLHFTKSSAVGSERSRRLGGCGLIAAFMLAFGSTGNAQTAPSTPVAATAPLAEGYFTEINGVEQWITIRGSDRRNPILLFLHGGPGMAASIAAPLFASWEKDFTVVQWDQPMSGATYGRNREGDARPLTIDRYVEDGVAVIEHVLGHLNADKLVVMGASWGSLIGIQIAHRRPDLLAAYVGTAQFVNGPLGIEIGYEKVVEDARARGDAAAVAGLERLGPPPFKSFDDFIAQVQYAGPPSASELAAIQKVGPVLFAPPPPDATYVPRDAEPFDIQKLALDALRALYPEASAYVVPHREFEIPMFCFQGELDLNNPTVIAKEFFDAISAPKKAFVVIPGAGHATTFFPDELLALLHKHVRPLAVDKAAPRL